MLVVFSEFQQFIRILLQGVGTNAQVSGMCVLHADTSAYLSSGSAHAMQTFRIKYGN